MATTLMAADMQNMPVFLNPSQDQQQQQQLGKLHMSASTTSLSHSTMSTHNNWENDISAFLMSNTEDMGLVPSSSPIIDSYYNSLSSPETSYLSPNASPYHSDVSQISSPFDPALFNNSPSQEVYSTPPQMYTPPQQDIYSSSPPHNDFSAPIDVDPALFEACNLTNPLLLPEIEKILASAPTQAIPPVSFGVSSNEPTSKKRAREIDINANVILSRDELLAMSSKEIEEYVSAIKTKRTLTAAEEKDLKKQRRLVKNREYASQSRSRKKQYVDDIEKQLEMARAETDAYKKQNLLLQEENKILKKQLAGIAEAIKKSQHGGAPNVMRGHHAPSHSPSHSPSLGSSAAGMFSQFTTIGGGRHTMVPSKTVSACVFVILFMVCTFATFWDNEPLGMTLFPNQNNGGHKFSNRHLLGLDLELEDVMDIPSSIPSPFPPSSPPTHSHSVPPIHKPTASAAANSSPSSTATLSPSSSSSSPSSLSSSSSPVFGLCYPHVYDASVNSSAWCSQQVLAL